ncbi:MAG: glycosyltransferase family 39 protein [Spirochaetales bacterium]|nr:glycosyltransferase family 39 protein [Spirochaetales bacterium]
MKKITAFLLLFLFLISPGFTQENLIDNGDFELLEHGLPRGWSTHTYTNSPDTVKFSVGHENAYTGRNYAVIENLREEDSKLVQSVEVEPNSTYRISCMVKVIDMGANGLGANLSLFDIMGTSADLKDTKGQWTLLELYGTTGPEQRSLAVTLRVGGYGRMNSGKAFFDNVVMQKVDRVPDGVAVINFYPEQKAAEAQAQEPKISYSVPVAVLIALLFLVVVLYLYRNVFKQKHEPLSKQRAFNAELLFGFTLLAGFIVRVWLAVTLEGYPSDLACFKAWAGTAFSKGLPDFYLQDMFVDYPPGYIYILYVIGFLQNLFGLGHNSPLFLLLVKLPSIATDVLIALLIYKFAKKRFHVRMAYTLAFLFLFNPAVMHNSSIYGQIDSFFVFFIILCLYFVYHKKVELGAVVYVAAVLIKPQALIFAPIGIYALVRQYKNVRDLKRIGSTVLCALATFIILIIPFTLKQDPFWIFNLYGGTLGSYPYATVNGFNLYMLVGANWVSAEGAFLGATFETWGGIFIAAIIGFAGLLCVHDYSRRKNPAFYFYLALFLIAAVFVLGTKMHERYFFPTVPLALFCYITFKDKRFLFLFAGFSVTLLLNQEMVLNLILTQNSTLIPRDNPPAIILSLLNVLLLGYLVWLGIDLVVGNKIRAAGPRRVKGLRSEAREAGVRDLMSAECAADLRAGRSLAQTRRLYTKKDYILIISLTLVYACAAFFNLGSFKAPQTCWKPQSPNESVIADLGEQKQIHRLYYFFGLGTGSYKLEFSLDKTRWESARTIEQNNRFGFLEWKYLPVNAEARYIKITVEQTGLMLNELGLFEKHGTVPLAVQNIIPAGKEYAADGAEHTADGAEHTAAGGALQSQAEHLFDEQDTIAYQPGYLNGFYFDEVYFARTAYEHRLGLPPSETTHPPLGKLIISFGIVLFGMVPFGWRFMGALLGIIMVPLMYMFGKKLFKKAELAFAAAFLFAFDFMHFVQTRIATIDVYAVFFVILMYYFMYRYYRLSFFEHDLKKTLKPLLFCGICFGLGAACKWTALYGGAGLAVIFFIIISRRLKEYIRARRIIKKGRWISAYIRGGRVFMSGKKVVAQSEQLAYARMAKKFLPNLLTTLLWCLLVFIVIPLLVYFLAYLPLLAAAAPDNPLSFVINDQAHMYNYHSRLTATHPFSSSWWEWPFMVRPMWYYSGHTMVPGRLVSSIVAMGNPAVWWVGSLCVLAAVCIAILHRDRKMLFIVIAFLSQYLPWVIIPRDLTFIYHFFTATPFLVICIVYVISYLVKRYPKTRYAVYGYLFTVLLLFALFYPILSGMTVAKSYVAAVLRWFESWIFYT